MKAIKYRQIKIEDINSGKKLILIRNYYFFFFKKNITFSSR